MKIIKRLAPFALTLVLLITPAAALAKTGKSAKVAKSTTAPVKPQGSCDQGCYQEFFDSIDNCNALHYIDEGLYVDCVSQAQRNLSLCQFFCRYGGILGKAQPKNVSRSVVRLTE